MAWNAAGEEPDGAADVDAGLRQDKKHSENAVWRELHKPALAFVTHFRYNKGTTFWRALVSVMPPRELK